MMKSNASRGAGACGRQPPGRRFIFSGAFGQNELVHENIVKSKAQPWARKRRQTRGRPPGRDWTTPEAPCGKAPSCEHAHPSARLEGALTACLYGIADQRLAKRPDRARNAMRCGDDVIEGVLDQVAVLIRNDERLQQLYGVARVPGDLGQHLVVLEQRDGDELAEQPLVRGFQEIPACLELQ